MDAVSQKLPTVHIPTLERMAIEEALIAFGGNRTIAAKYLGIHTRTIQRKLKCRHIEVAAPTERCRACGRYL